MRYLSYTNTLKIPWKLSVTRGRSTHTHTHGTALLQGAYCTHACQYVYVQGLYIHRSMHTHINAYNTLTCLKGWLRLSVMNWKPQISQQLVLVVLSQRSTQGKCRRPTVPRHLQSEINFPWLAPSWQIRQNNDDDELWVNIHEFHALHITN